MANLIGSWNPERLQRVVIGAHYDTRPAPRPGVDPDRHKLPFLGANDGASGVALLMEIANHLSDLETPWGVDLVLFDGEELVFGNDPRVGEYFLGSKEFARIYADSVDRRRTEDAVRGRAGARHGRRPQAPDQPGAEQPETALPTWSARSGPSRGPQCQVVPLRRRPGGPRRPPRPQRAGIPAIDLIDFDYPYWHKADDLPENCSAESLAEVGRVVTAWLTLPAPHAPLASPSREPFRITGRAGR